MSPDFVWQLLEDPQNSPFLLLTAEVYGNSVIGVVAFGLQSVAWPDQRGNSTGKLLIRGIA